MRRYEEYKDSGINWLGDIPSTWKVIRVKDLGNLQNGISNSKEYFGSGFPFVSYGNVYNDSINLSNIKTLANSNDIEQKHYSVLSGDVFFTRTSETIKEIGIASTCLQTIPKAIFSGFTIRLRPKKKLILKEFSRFSFKAHINREFLSKEISLVTRASLGQNLLNNLPVLLPPKNEQQAIANYLDAKTQAIDKKVSLLEQKIETYKQLKRTHINQTITKGLRSLSEVEMKDSGISWIGQIPQHWEVKRFKDVLLKNDGGVWGEFADDGTIVLRSTEVDIDGNWKIDNPAICKLTFKEIKSSLLEKGDLLITKSSGSDLHIGKTAFVDDYVAGLQCCYSNFMQRLRINKKNYSKYYFWFLNSEISKLQYLYNTKSTTGLGNLSSEIFNLLITVVPPKSEQEEIAKYLDHKTATIDAIVSNIGKQIDTLKQLRKTLINDVVTGKIKVVE